MQTTMTNAELIELLNDKHACVEARDWVNGQSAQEAWEKCERPDWLFWFCGTVGVQRKQLVLAACGCVRLALKFVEEGEDRPRLCIEMTERWARGKATIEEVQQATQAANAYANSVAYTYAATSYAAIAAVHIAATNDVNGTSNDVTIAVSSVVRAASFHANTAITNTATANAIAAKKQMERDCAAVIRKVISFDEVLTIIRQSYEAKPSRG